MNFSSILNNIKHWQTTALGIAMGASAFLSSDMVKSLSTSNATIAHYVGTAIAVVAGAVSILGVGGKLLNTVDSTPTPPAA